MPERLIYLVRHGQYKMDRDSSRYGRLTKLGKHQARRVAKRLLEFPIDRIYYSDMIRAKETAKIISKQFEKVKGSQSELLREGIPNIPTWLKQDRTIQKKRVKATRKRMNQAFHKFFTPTTKKNKHTLLVCHGNIIRYLLCKGMKIRRTAWVEMEIYQCSLCIFKIKSSGLFKIHSYNDIGHIKPINRTFF